MIDYKKTKVGDILKIVGNGAPGWAVLGDLVRVTHVMPKGVAVEKPTGETAEFSFDCGAARLSPTEWEEDGVPVNNGNGGWRDDC